jgi:hypothetical protein
MSVVSTHLWRQDGMAPRWAMLAPFVLAPTSAVGVRNSSTERCDVSTKGQIWQKKKTLVFNPTLMSDNSKRSWLADLFSTNHHRALCSEII